MFSTYFLLTPEERNTINTIKDANREPCPPFLDRGVANAALKRLVLRIADAIDAGLIADPVYAGACAGAIVTLTASMCFDYEAAENYAESWRDYDTKTLDKFLSQTEADLAKAKKGGAPAALASDNDDFASRMRRIADSGYTFTAGRIGLLSRWLKKEYMDLTDENKDDETFTYWQSGDRDLDDPEYYELLGIPAPE